MLKFVLPSCLVGLLIKINKLSLDRDADDLSTKTGEFLLFGGIV